MTHTKQRVEVPLPGTDRVVSRTRLTCENGKAFTVTADGSSCPSCGQMFNMFGQTITHKGY